MIWLQLVISLILTVFIYLTFPVIFLFVKGKVPAKKAGKLALLNSIILGITFSVIAMTLNLEQSSGTMFASAFFYYFIAKAILTDKHAVSENANRENSSRVTAKENISQNSTLNSIAVTDNFDKNNEKLFSDLLEDPDRYTMDKDLAEKYTRMFKEPFDQVIAKSEFIVNNKKCAMYGFSPLYLNRCIRSGFDIGRFAYFVVVQGDKPRYFASEYSFNNTFVLCEWEFEGENKTGHINYGDVVSSVSDMLNHSSNIKKKLQEILT